MHFGDNSSFYFLWCKGFLGKKRQGILFNQLKGNNMHIKYKAFLYTAGIARSHNLWEQI
jgi:hypothetical protein